MDPLVIAVGPGIRLELDIDHGLLVAKLATGHRTLAMGLGMSGYGPRCSIYEHFLNVGGTSFLSLSPQDLDAIRAWLTEQGHEFVDLAEEKA